MFIKNARRKEKFCFLISPRTESAVEELIFYE
jgi:hypothetical protein